MATPLAAVTIAAGAFAWMTQGAWAFAAPVPPNCSARPPSRPLERVLTVTHCVTQCHSVVTVFDCPTERQSPSVLGCVAQVLLLQTPAYDN